jgi:hypothetical protein
MANVNNTVSDIIRSLPGSSSLRTSKLLSDLEAVKKQIPEGNKYQTRAQLDGAGVGRVYDDLQSKVMFADKFETARKTASVKLLEQQSKLTEFNDVITKFRQQNVIPGQEAEFADEILSNLETILNSQSNGEFLFGGGNSNVKPVSDLNNKTNIVNGRASTNYTEATSVNIDSSISEKHTVNLGLISANNPGIAAIIAAVNVYKENPQNQQQIDLFLNQGITQFGSLENKVRTAITDVNDAKVYNSRVTTSATEQIQSISAGDVVTFAEIAKGNIQSLLANFTLAEINNTVSDRLFNR